VTSPDILRSNLVAKLRDIPSLVALLGGNAANIVEFIEETEGDSFGTITKLKPPKLLVMYTGTLPRTQMEYWQHNFSLITRVSGSPSAVFQQIVDGIPAGGSGLRMLYEPIHFAVHPMEIPSMQRRVIPVSEQSSFDYWEILTSFVENRVGG
jgi:hypothetical protein